MKPKQWHIWDFPDNIYVLIKKEVREEFFKTMYKKFGSQINYARFLKVDRNCVQGYCYARSWYKGRKPVKFMPIWVLKKSLLYIKPSFKARIENNVISIRGKGGGEICSPILPIKESPEFYRVVAHILGDGNDSHTPYYSNTCDTLINKFKRDLQIFGKIKLCDAVNKQGVKYTSFTKTATYILSYLLDVKFTHPNRLPKTIFNASENCKSAFLQAFFDDEGTVTSALSVCAKNKNIIIEIKRILKSLRIETGKISKKWGVERKINYKTDIKSRYIPLFQEKINFLHPEKHRKLQIRIKIMGRNKVQRTRPLEWTRNEILRLLRKKPMRTLELCEKLLLTMSGLYYHLNYLKEKGYIKREGHRNKVLWKIS